ncbi:nucleotidyltransferase domain-containing protein [Aquimarina agarivorans]|uniref:nucleotidyltransferase domain-containing protein n=1 Tax=Aquimarina agarivorans TaxID=980584 RepID=UPI000248F91C|nr:nucleotidyltransferase [Aquimarina agarivorans]
MNNNYKNELSEILNELGDHLDISKAEYDAAVKSYEAVGDWLSKPTSPLHQFNPKILPQGSFMLGTMIKPINQEDDLDVDLVCKLENKPYDWTQKDLKNAIGNRLKNHDTYNSMIEDIDGGQRCWTLKYSDNSNYHMDILPAFADENFTVFLNESFNNYQDTDTKKIAIRITDKELDNYDTEIDTDYWMKSNPFGYAKWFIQKATISSTKMMTLNEAVDPLREFEKEKPPLKRVIQLLKRHRDIMFSDSAYDIENKPISIIITTLASRAYDKSENLIDAYINIVSNMKSFIEDRVNIKTGKTEKWVVNPINNEENFADKWTITPQKETYFYEWLDELEKDLEKIRNSHNVGLHNLNESFTKMYGKNISNNAFKSYGNKKRIIRENGKLSMSKATGLLGTSGIKIKNHEFRGSVNEK